MSNHARRLTALEAEHGQRRGPTKAPTWCCIGLRICPRGRQPRAIVAHERAKIRCSCGTLNCPDLAWEQVSLVLAPHKDRSQP